MNVHALHLEELKQQLNTDLDKGLSTDEANKRLSKFGPNQLPEKKPPSSWDILKDQFKSPLVYILLFAELISIFLQHWGDALVISFALILNTILGYIQEKKAIDILTKLKKLVHFEAKVIREGKERLIPAEEIVPGDILILDPGDKIVADARLIKEDDLEIIEASLTGESIPSIKNVGILPTDTTVADRENMAYSGRFSWSGAGVYYSLAATDFTLERGGVGYIAGKQMTWAGSQSTGALSGCAYK